MLIQGPEKSSSSSNLKRLALLRGLMLLAELLAVLGANFIAGIPLPLPPLFIIFSLMCYSLLFFFYRPLGNDAHIHHDQAFSQHIFGMWFGFALSAALIAWFVVGISNSLRQRDKLLAQAREQALRDEQLVALGTLATGAAHELGTPLSTMAVITRELERSDVPESTEHKLKILRSQIDRCKQALSVISASAGELRAESGGLVPVHTWLQRIVETWKAQRPDRSVAVDFPSLPTNAAIIDEQTLQQSIVNLLNNAADASDKEIDMSARWDERHLTIEILDRGAGLHPNASATLGEQQTSNKENGMGLGLLLTHATLQRLGGDIVLFDRQGGGTCTRVRIPLTQPDISQ